MNEMAMGFGGTLDGFSAVSMDELDLVEGGKGFWSKVGKGLLAIGTAVVLGAAGALGAKAVSKL